MIKLKELFDEFVFGNYFIAVCAVAMIFSTSIINRFPILFTPATIFVTVSTYLLYNFHRHSFHIDYSGRNSLVNSVKGITLKSSEKAGYTFALLIMLYYFFQLSERILLYLIPLALLAIAYSAPLIKSRGRKFRLKEVFFIKTPVIALVWALTTTVIPLVEQNISLQSSFIFWQIVSKTLFIFALCIPFEMRDIEIDRKNNVSTLAVVHGKKYTQIIGVIIILLELLTHHMMNGISANMKLALDLSSIVALIYILFQNSGRSGYYYKFFIDGTMILRFLFLFLLTGAS